MPIPLLIAGLVAGGVSAAASGIAGGAAAAAGLGKNKEKVNPYTPGAGGLSGQVRGYWDPGSGRAGEWGANTATGRQLADYEQKWKNAKGADWNQQFRGNQEQLIAQLQAQAAGQGPSAAQAQLQAAKDQTMAQQMAMAAGARGSGALAGAQMAAAQNAALATQQAGAQSASLRAQEQQQATQLLSQTLAGARGQDMEQNQVDFAAKMQLQQFYERLGFDTQQSKMMADMEMRRMDLQSWDMEQRARLGQAQANADADARLFGATMGGISSGIGMMGTAGASGGGGKGGK